MLLRLTSPSFALRRSGRIAQMLHHGPFSSEVSVEGNSARIQVDGFLFLRERNYREQLASGLRVLVRLTGHAAESEIEYWDEETFRVVVRWT